MFQRDDLGFPKFWTMQIAAWICFYLWGSISLLPFLRQQPGALRGSSVFFASLFIASSLLRPVCRRLIGRQYSWIALELRAFSWALPVGMLAGYLNERIPAFGQPVTFPGWLADAVRSTFILFVWCSLYFSIKLWQQTLREKDRLLRAQAEVRDVRLSALRYQLNPHFLFNSLNAVSTLVLEENPPAATRMLSQIGDFLRTILAGDASPELPLSDEIAFAGQYLAIEQTRLGSRLRVDLAIAPETLDALVPGMLLQPLIENAVRHGVAPVVKGGTVRVASALAGDRLLIHVQNSGPSGSPSPPESANGIGIRNTQERLQTLYGDGHRFLLQWPDDGGCHVTVELPFRKSERRPLLAGADRR
jgi:two-component system, LytTR family, sensor kinase